MNPCENCHIEEKVYVCCGRHPEDGSRVPLHIGSDRVVMACRFLDHLGRCTIYGLRPAACRDFFCERFDGAVKNSISVLCEIPYNFSDL